MTANAKRNRLEETATKTPEKVSIPFTRSTSKPFNLNDSQLRWSCKSSYFHNGFNGLLMNYELIQMGVKSTV